MAVALVTGRRPRGIGAGGVTGEAPNVSAGETMVSPYARRERRAHATHRPAGRPARHGGADHVQADHVLVAAAFCMFNRFVDGLAGTTPTDPAVYEMIGQRLADVGYGSPAT